MSQEARMTATGHQHEQVTITNTTGAALVKGEVFFIQEAGGRYIGYVAQEAIASGATGEAIMAGALSEFSMNKKIGSALAVGEDVYWSVGHNYVVNRSNAKAGDYFIGEVTKAAASSDSFVLVRLEKPVGVTQPSVSSSISSSSASSSVSSVSTSTSSSSGSTSSQSSSSSSGSSGSIQSSISSNSTSVSTSVSVSSNSNSSSSGSVSVSSNSDAQ
jgi:predicted RecA/RadA family phage recombinase